MNLIKNILTVTALSIFIYLFKLYSVTKAGIIYHFLELPIRKNDVIFNMQCRILFESILYLFVIVSVFFILKYISNYIKIDKIFLLVVVVSPFIFELSTILYDKSCFKSWYNLDILIWYFPIRLILWLVIFFCFKDLFLMLKIKRNLIIISLVFFIFHFSKIYSNYNF
jgi:hypothetical protein